MVKLHGGSDDLLSGGVRRWVYEITRTGFRGPHPAGEAGDRRSTCPRAMMARAEVAV
jgi:hypothetical protein